jgi:hypothetical protein
VFQVPLAFIYSFSWLVFLFCFCAQAVLADESLGRFNARDRCYFGSLGTDEPKGSIKVRQASPQSGVIAHDNKRCIVALRQVLQQVL